VPGPARLEPAGRVGHDQHLRAQRDQHPGRERHVGGAVALVQVHAALHRDAGRAAAGADHQPTGVAVDLRHREPGQLAVRDAHRIGQAIGEPAQARAEDEADLGRAAAQARAHHRRGGVDAIVEIVGGVGGHAALPYRIVSMTRLAGGGGTA
jgi:hypothetical protein